MKLKFSLETKNHGRRLLDKIAGKVVSGMISVLGTAVDLRAAVSPKPNLPGFDRGCGCNPLSPLMGKPPMPFMGGPMTGGSTGGPMTGGPYLVCFDPSCPSPFCRFVQTHVLGETPTPTPTVKVEPSSFFVDEQKPGDPTPV